MEDYKNEKKSDIEVSTEKPFESLPPEFEIKKSQSDRIKHSQEQSSANISQGLNGSDDGSMVLPIVDDSLENDNVSTKAPLKIQVSDVDVSASDSDRIEKIWVDKAKAIIQESAGDPHTKSANLSVEKSQYRAARFNKLINNR